MAGRPLGITILAILQLLGALGLLLLGVAALALLSSMPLLAALIAIAPLIIGIIMLVLFYGLWTLKGWAWIWTLIINILGIIFDVMSTPIPMFSLAIGVIIVVYLLVPTTRSAFKQ